MSIEIAVTFKNDVITTAETKITCILQIKKLLNVEVGIKVNRPAIRSVHTKDVERLRMLFGSNIERLKITMAKEFSIRTILPKNRIIIGSAENSTPKFVSELLVFVEFMVV